MPLYVFRCEACEDQHELLVKLADFDVPQPCPDCESSMRRLVVPVAFNLPGDDWASKNGRVAKQMREKNVGLKAKQNERRRDQPMVTLAPNVNGERVGSWSEAQKMAGSNGKDTSSYDTLIRKERASKK